MSVHYLTGKPSAPCPQCGRMSGLSGVDGGPCMTCILTPQVTCHDCLVVQPAVFTEPTVDGYLQECVNSMVTIHHETEKT